LDGFNFFRLDKPIFGPKLGLEPRGCEDPRLVKIEGKFYLTYTAYSEKGMRIGLACTENFIRWERLRIDWPNINNKNAVLFPEKIKDRYVLFHRPMAKRPIGIWVSYSEDLINWSEGERVMSPAEPWEKEKIGAGAPPIKTEKGWLLIYHAVDKDGVYRLGAAMFDLKDPTKLLCRHPEPILEPEEDYEVRGEVPYVVFACGICEVENRFYIYYGGADKVICVATISKDEILSTF
jgi:predicted GH43/DUF377 family glycosyl hydrolase